ncbi:aspartic peptidase domain-containing protein [Mycena albidolilacea]|uniref:Aspartic peptidase domain-containing protein n=1 Tax=Mycena albidolilacea TaxID=1033008 RepID=A0AAD7A4H8_9AGAR|nr:aspartic peptidase domain-containing protein [Mycena albidolilacea]
MGPWLVKGQSFAMVDRTVDLGLSSTSTSGILGFCFPSVAAIPTNVGQTLLASLMSLFPPPLQCFAFWLSRDANRAGSLTIGTLDFTLVPNPALIANFSVVRTGHEFDYWKLPLLHLTIDDQLFTLSSSRIPGAANPIAVLDTGTTLILGPFADVKALYATLGSAARYDSDIGYQVLCKHAVIIGFVFGFPAREFRLHPADIAWAEGGTEDEWCTGGIQANDNVNSGDWLLGDCFLRNVYAIHCYSPPSIGLLSMTTFPEALEEFRAERGDDGEDGGDGDDDSDLVSAVVDGSDRWATATGYVKRWEQPPSGTAARVFGTVAGGFGFVVGGIGAASWRFWRGV